MAILAPRNNLKSAQLTGTHPTPTRAADSASTRAADSLRKEDPRFELVKSWADKGDYRRALQTLPTDSRDAEIRNCRAVCLIRLHQFEAAVDLLRADVLNTGTVAVKQNVAEHIVINFATALLFGGYPAGAMDVLCELNDESHPDVQVLRTATRQWVAQMNWLRRLDWRFNRVAPKTPPPVPSQTLGRFCWESSAGR